LTFIGRRNKRFCCDNCRKTAYESTAQAAERRQLARAKLTARRIKRRLLFPKSELSARRYRDKYLSTFGNRAGPINEWASIVLPDLKRIKLTADEMANVCLLEKTRLRRIAESPQ
jgi:hypothetical protein